jgi:hypoxanthine phosphoribosyltransferase
VIAEHVYTSHRSTAALYSTPRSFGTPGIISLHADNAVEMHEIVTARLPPGERLSRVAAALGFAALEKYLKRLTLTNACFFGVNRGGHLLAKLLAERAGLNSDYLIKCTYRSEIGEVSLDADIPLDATTFIIVDDVVRTGKTMAAVRAYLRDCNSAAKQYAIALAAVSPDYQGRGVPYDIDYCLWISQDANLKFPWSDTSKQEPDPDPSHYIDNIGVNQVGGFLTEQGRRPGIADFVD